MTKCWLSNVNSFDTLSLTISFPFLPSGWHGCEHAHCEGEHCLLCQLAPRGHDHSQGEEGKSRRCHCRTWTDPMCRHQGNDDDDIDDDNVDDIIESHVSMCCASRRNKQSVDHQLHGNDDDIGDDVMMTLVMTWQRSSRPSHLFWVISITIVDSG